MYLGLLGLRGVFETDVYWKDTTQGRPYDPRVRENPRHESAFPMKRAHEGLRKFDEQTAKIDEEGSRRQSNIYL